MATNEPAPEPKADATPPAPERAVAREVEPRPDRTWPSLLVAGLTSAILTGAAGEVTATRIDPGGNSALSPMEGGGPSLESIRRATLLNAAFTYGVQGGTLGLLLGLAGAAGRRSIKRALIGGTVGLTSGAVVGACASLGTFTMFLDHVDPNSDNLVPPLLAHASVWGLLGAAGGLAYGLGRGGCTARAVLGGLLGAAVGAALYEVAGAVLFAGDKTTRPLADARLPRLVGYAATDLLAALGVGLAVAEPRSLATKPIDGRSS
jgi:hypothetical protein